MWWEATEAKERSVSFNLFLKETFWLFYELQKRNSRNKVTRMEMKLYQGNNDLLQISTVNKKSTEKNGVTLTK